MIRSSILAFLLISPVSFATPRPPAVSGYLRFEQTIENEKPRPKPTLIRSDSTSVPLDVSHFTSSALAVLVRFSEVRGRFSVQDNNVLEWAEFNGLHPEIEAKHVMIYPDGISTEGKIFSRAEFPSIRLTVKKITGGLLKTDFILQGPIFNKTLFVSGSSMKIDGFLTREDSIVLVTRLRAADPFSQSAFIFGELKGDGKFKIEGPGHFIYSVDFTEVDHRFVDLTKDQRHASGIEFAGDRVAALKAGQYVVVGGNESSMGLNNARVIEVLGDECVKNLAIETSPHKRNFR